MTGNTGESKHGTSFMSPFGVAPKLLKYGVSFKHTVTNPRGI